jgi:hypothetical protein
MAGLQFIKRVITGTNLMEELDKVMVKLSLRYLNYARAVNKDSSSISSIRNCLVVGG